MGNKEQLIRARLAILALAAEVKNVAKACKLARVSRSQFYVMKKAYETYGEEGLAPRVRRKPNMSNRTSAGLEEQILVNTSRNPTVSYIRLSEEMRSGGAVVTPTMVRYVWQRHGLSTRALRLEWVKQSNGQAGNAKNVIVRTPLYRPPSLPAASGRPASSSESRNGGKSFAGKGSGVDWAYWSRVVRESLTR